MIQSSFWNGIAMLEVIDSQLSLIDRYHIVLASQQKKPAGSFSLVSKVLVAPGRYEKYHTHELLPDIFEQLGIPFTIIESGPYFGRWYMDVTYGENQHQLYYPYEGLRPATSKADKDTILGKIYGYPETAIKGFATGRHILDFNLPVKIDKSPMKELLGFSLSVHHCEEEVPMFIQQAQEVIEIAPWLLTMAKSQFDAQKR